MATLWHELLAYLHGWILNKILLPNFFFPSLTSHLETFFWKHLDKIAGWVKASPRALMSAWGFLVWRHSSHSSYIRSSVNGAPSVNKDIIKSSSESSNHFFLSLKLSISLDMLIALLTNKWCVLQNWTIYKQYCRDKPLT